MDTQARPPARAPGPLATGSICGALAILLLVPGLGGFGFWSDAELPALNRTLAALGQPLSGLLRSPWFPDAVRTSFYSIVPSELGVRLPHAVASSILVAITGGLARARGASFRMAIVAAAFALAFPVLLMGGRMLVGNPIGELVGVVAVVLGVGAMQAETTRRRIGLGVLAAGALSLSIASNGLLLGGSLPLCAIAVARDEKLSRGAGPVLWAAVLVSAGVALLLAVRQGDGYIPLLGAAKDLELIDKPFQRRFASGIEDLGYQLFPWLPLVLIGVLNPGRQRWPALWLLVGVAMTTAWTVVYGPIPLPLTVPAALCCLAAVEHLASGEGRPVTLRLALVVIVGGMLVLGKDAERTPSRVGAPLHHFDGERAYPADELEARRLFSRLTKLGALAVLLLAAVGHAGRRSDGRIARMLGRVPGPRERVPAAIAIAVLGYQALAFGQGLVPNTAQQLSPRIPLEHSAAWIDSGQLPAVLGSHRVRDDGALRYYPDETEIVELSSRRELNDHMKSKQPAAALIRSSELPSLHQRHRQHGWPLFVLDRTHWDLMLVANVLPEGAEDHNPIPSVVFDEAPELVNQTLVRFGNYVEIIGWEVEEPVVRGRPGSLHMVFRVLRPLPAGSKLITRLQKGKSSRVNAEPHILAEDIYPCNYWREGDYILHRHTFETPWLEILSGKYAVIVALKRGEKKHYDITVPEQKNGEFGVRIKDSKRYFAVIGYVDVW